MRKKSPETFSVTDQQQEKEKTLEKKKNPEAEQQREQKERPTKIEGRISGYIKNLEERENKVEKFLQAKDGAIHNVDVAKARIQVPDREHEKRKKKDYQSYEQEFEKKKIDSDTHIGNLEQEKQRLERLYKEGPKDIKEALSIKREHDGSKSPSGVFGSLRENLMLAFRGNDIKKEVNALLRKEKKERPSDGETPERIVKIQDQIKSLKREKENLSVPETYKDEIQKIQKEEKDFFLKHCEEKYSKLSEFLTIDEIAIEKKLQGPSLKEDDLFLLMEDIGKAQAELTKRHHETKKFLERTRFGYLSVREGKDSPRVDTSLDTKLEIVTKAVQKNFEKRMLDSQPKKLDNADLRYLNDKDIIQIAKIEVSLSKTNEEFLKNEEKIKEELSGEREKAKAEAMRRQNEVIFHTSRQDNFLKILDDQLYSMRALRAAHPEKASTAVTTSIDDKYIFFQPESPASGYGVGGEKGSAICGFATVEGFLMKSALTTDTGANPGRSEVAALGVDGAATVMDPSDFVVYMPESTWKKAEPIIAEKYKDTSLPEIVVYPDTLLRDGSEEGVRNATQEIARLVKERVQEVQKRGGYHVEPGGIRTTPNGYEYYEEDTAAW